MKKLALFILCISACFIANGQETVVPTTPVKDAITEVAIPSSAWSLYANVGNLIAFRMLDIGGQLVVGRHWSAEADLRCDPFKSSLFKTPQLAVTASVSAVYWFFYPYSGWWVSGGPQFYYQSFFSSSHFHHSDIGLCGCAGYSFMVHRHWNINFGIGGWMGWETEVDTILPWYRVKFKDTNRFFLEYDRLIIGVSYVF